jgi:hypothetical protein
MSVDNTTWSRLVAWSDTVRLMRAVDRLALHLSAPCAKFVHNGVQYATFVVVLSYQVCMHVGMCMHSSINVHITRDVCGDSIVSGVCMCVHVYICMYSCMNTHTHKHTHTRRLCLGVTTFRFRRCWQSLLAPWTYHPGRSPYQSGALYFC